MIRNMACSFPESLYIRHPFFHAFPALDQKRSVAVFREKQGTEKTRRTGADDDRPVQQRFAALLRKSPLVGGRGSDIFIPCAVYEGCFLFCGQTGLHLYCINIKKLRLFARIYGMACDPVNHGAGGGSGGASVPGCSVFALNYRKAGSWKS